MDEKEFDRLAMHCRIRLSEAEKAGIRKEIDEVIRYFGIISEIECDSLQEAYHPIDIGQRTRPDRTDEYDDAQGLLRNTKTYRFYVVGPRV